ncbi:MAG: hypothetical protein AB7J28_15425 [Hyphomonadaceae bacterium]
MAKVEIEQSELETYRNGLALLQKMNATPEARRHMERSLKVLDPNLETEEDISNRLAAPHLERVQKAEETVAELKKRLDDEADARRRAEEESYTQRELSKLDDPKLGLTDEGKEEIKKLMTTRKIADVDAALALHERLNPKPEPLPSSYEASSWNLRGDTEDKNINLLFKNEDLWADQEAQKTLNQMRREQAMAAA